MTVFSSLKRSEADIRAMEQKKAELEVMPPIDFWHCPDTDEDDDKAAAVAAASDRQKKKKKRMIMAIVASAFVIVIVSAR